MNTTGSIGEVTSASQLAPTPRRLGMCGQYVDRQIASLWRQRERSPIKGTLAHLRRSVSAEPGTVPEIWQWTIEGVPGQARGDAPTREERAVHLAMCLFAIHQQSEDTPMHVPARSFGQAVRRLADADKGDSFPQETPIYRRFMAAATSMNIDEAATYIRSITNQLNAAHIGYDHAAIADDLFQLQFDTTGRVQRRWARDFSRLNTPEQSEAISQPATQE